jgi:hypothetical protein
MSHPSLPHAPDTRPAGLDTRVRGHSTDSTRYLCAAAYLDDSFARRVLDEVLEQPHRAIAPSYGIDLGPIIRHCLEASRRLLVRDGLVSAALGLVVVLGVARGSVMVLVVLSLWAGASGWRLVKQRSFPVGLTLLGFSGLVLLWAFQQLPEALNGLLLTLGGQGQDGGSGFAVLAFLALIAIWACYFVYRINVHRIIATELVRGQFDGSRAPSAPSNYEGRIAYVENAQHGNVTVYSPNWAHNPFIGSGGVLTEWNLVTPLRHDATRGEPAAPLDAKLVYEYTRQGLVGLAHPSLPPEERVSQLSVQDRIFISGLLPPGSAFLDADRRPVTHVDAETVDAVGRGQRAQLRHYQSVRIAAWNGELEVTGFLYVAIRGGMLFVEFVSTMLPGIDRRYHAIDTMERPGAGVTLGAAMSAVADTAGCFRAPVNVGVVAGNAMRRLLDPAVESRDIDRRLGYDHGARTSVREIGTEFPGSVRFQYYDAQERVSLVERQLLQVVVEMLKDRGYDISDIAGQATTIINQSTVVGSVSGTGIAIGTQAKATVTSRPPK